MKRWIAGTALACVCALGCATGFAQGTDETAMKLRLDQVANAFTKGNSFMGTVLVASGDHVLLDKGYGSADLEWSIPNAPDVKFRLGSLTKQFTATLVLLLQQDGKLKIDDPVSKYLPDAPSTISASIEIARRLHLDTGESPESQRVGFMEGRGDVGREFFNPLPHDELCLWSGEGE